MVFIHVVIYLKKIKDGAYLINLHEYADTDTHWIFLRVNGITKAFINIVSWPVSFILPSSKEKYMQIR